jgi:hypothetical protein
MTNAVYSDEEAAKVIKHHATLSGLLAHEHALQLLAHMTDDHVENFIDVMDGEEIEKIWTAAGELGYSESIGEGVFIQSLFNLAFPYGGTHFLRLSKALIENDPGRYITWFKEWSRLATISRNERLSEPFDRVSALALKEILVKADASAVADLSHWIVTAAPSPSRLKYLDTLAGLDMSGADQHPLLDLKLLNADALYRALSIWWEPQRDRCLIREYDKPWSDFLETRYTSTPASIAFLAEHGGDFLALPIGYLSGVAAAVTGDIDSELKKYGVVSNSAVFLPVAQTWHFLSKISDYRMRRGNDHETELLGLRKALLDNVTRHPQSWITSLHWIFLHAEVRDVKSDTVAITCQLNQIATPRLENLLADNDGVVATLARGILALLTGTNDPASANIAYLADSLAHYHDGTLKFPSPLSLRSATWICSNELEQYFRDGVKRATAYFDHHVAESHTSPEESLTGTLMNELVVQFRDSLKILSTVKPQSSDAPTLRLAQRDFSKTKEEPIYGCDLAFLIRAQAPEVYKMEWTDIVQVKKSLVMSNSEAKSNTADSWEIDIRQLRKILLYSASAVYFLLCANGGTLVVPARFLLGFVGVKAGSEANKTRTIGYHMIRSAAIPLEQYLVDLLIGQWIGTNSKRALSFVKGNQVHRPRAVFEITIEFQAPRG